MCSAERVEDMMASILIQLNNDQVAGYCPMTIIFADFLGDYATDHNYFINHSG